MTSDEDGRAIAAAWDETPQSGDERAWNPPTTGALRFNVYRVKWVAATAMVHCAGFEHEADALRFSAALNRRVTGLVLVTDGTLLEHKWNRGHDHS